MARKTSKRSQADEIRASLVDQLTMQGKIAAFYLNLVDDYMSYWEVKQELLADIKKRGAVVEGVSGNGFPYTKANDSIAILNKTTATMLKLLSDLNLREPTKSDTGTESYF